MVFKLNGQILQRRWLSSRRIEYQKMKSRGPILLSTIWKDFKCLGDYAFSSGFSESCDDENHDIILVAHARCFSGTTLFLLLVQWTAAFTSLSRWWFFLKGLCGCHITFSCWNESDERESRSSSQHLPSASSFLSFSNDTRKRMSFGFQSSSLESCPNSWSRATWLTCSRLCLKFLQLFSVLALCQPYCKFHL